MQNKRRKRKKDTIEKRQKKIREKNKGGWCEQTSDNWKKRCKIKDAKEKKTQEKKDMKEKKTRKEKRDDGFFLFSRKYGWCLG